MIAAWRRGARAIEPVMGSNVLDDLRIGTGSPEPLHVGSTGLEGSEVVRRPVEEADRAIGHREVAHIRDKAGRIEGDVVREPSAGRPVQTLEPRQRRVQRDGSALENPITAIRAGSIRGCVAISSRAR